MYCKKCGTKLPDGAFFCKKCGEPVTGAPQNKNGSIGKAAGRSKPVLMIGTSVAVLGILAAAVFFLIKGKSGSEKIFGEDIEMPGVIWADSETLEGDVLEEEVPETPPRNIAADLAAERERQIEALYGQKILLREAVRSVVADFMEGTSFVAVPLREQFSIQEVLVDEVTGNPVLSEGVKTMIQSASEGKSVEDICRDVLQSAGAQIPDYLSGLAEGALQDMVTDVIGVNLFSEEELH